MQSNAQLQRLLNIYRSKPYTLPELQCESEQNNYPNPHKTLFNGTSYKLSNHQIQSKSHFHDIIKHKGSYHSDHQISNQIENHTKIQKPGDPLKNQNEGKESSTERKIIGLNKLKYLTKQRQSYDKQDKKIKQIKLGGKRASIKLYTSKKLTEEKQINSQVTKNLTTQQSKGTKTKKHNQSIESKSLQKKFNIQKSIQRFQILKTLADDEQKKSLESNTNHNNGKRQIKSFKVLTKKQFKKNNENICTTNQEICQTEISQNKENQILASNIFTLKKDKFYDHPTNIFLLQKRQIKIVTSKTFNKKREESRENLQKHQKSFIAIDEPKKLTNKT